MRILVVGAGAIGGYFGGRLLQAGNDVTFLVRAKRAAELAGAGLVIKSPHGDITLKNPPTLQAGAFTEKFDAVLLSCKAFDLDDAIASFAPAVGPDTAIIPMLNGMRHLDVLEQKFGAAHVMGGQCQIAATLNAQREVVQMTPMQALSFGERNGSMSARLQKLAAVMASGNFDGKPSTTILHDMWEKWVFLATIAGATSVMRAAIGDIIAAPDGRDFILGVRDECASVASANGFAPRAAFLERTVGMLTAVGSKLTASMFRDILIGAPIEADQIIGDLIARADAAKMPVPKLRVIYTHLKTYENARA
ncbi:2-dehydropantoate 2-reductase [Tardiphaga sp.]|uniref:2-dehydropantoate 2-reductase n=1 Tax=Tardiphaga sp. TaxID=1926292 RepID=UPI00261C2805|nr:2-dehydropantoate 2-reductase [Tardiphaga sp.]MDB5616377.1 2-dehydropantoate 2-reductase [Tardiphaga sp.]